MASGHISKRNVDSLACPEGKDREFLWDDELPGFGIVAFASGQKSYCIQYRAAGRPRRVTLGEHGRLTPTEARGLAKSMLASVAMGANPADDRRTARTMPTFADVVAEFGVLHLAKRKTWTAIEYDRLIRNHLQPAFGTRRLTDIRRQDVARFHANLAANPATANKCIAVLSSFWNFAANRGEVSASDNPCAGLSRFQEQSRTRFLSTEELGRLGMALDTAQIDGYARAAILLLLLTGCRVREILDAKWRNLDLVRQTLHLEDSKTGAKFVHLSPAAISVIISLPRLANNPHLIPGREAGEARQSLDRPWQRLTAAASLPGLRLHDLRHCFAAISVSGGTSLHVTGSLLGHAKSESTKRYAHIADHAAKTAVARIGEELTTALRLRK